MQPAKKRGDWQARYGAQRRKTDRALLAEAERQIEAEDERRCEQAAQAAFASLEVK